MRACGLYFSQAVIWVKEHPVLTRKDFMGNHEWCFYGWKKGAGPSFFGPANVTDVWSVKKVNPQSMVHLTEKPVELAARALEYSSRPGENVLDLFGGSGSMLIAYEQAGRHGFLMELDPLYGDVIVARYEQLAKLERVHGAGRCPRCRDRQERLTVFGPCCEADDYLAGRVPQPELPPEASPCRACGWEPTVTVIYEVVVNSPEQVQALDAHEREEREGTAASGSTLG